MTKKHCCLPPGALDELITRLDALEKEQAKHQEFRTAIERPLRAFLVVLGIWRLPDPEGGGDERRDGEGPIRLDG